MRIHRANLAEFVGASFVVPQNPFLAPGLAGLADFVDADFAVPQNPILDAFASGGGLAEFVGAHFVVPQNPILDGGVGDMVGTDAMYPILPNSVIAEYESGGLGDCGCGCNGHGDCGGGLAGLTDDISGFISTQWAQITAGDMTTIALWGGGALLLAYLLFSRSPRTRSAYRSGKAELSKEYRAKLRELRAASPTTGGRLVRAGRAAAGAF